MKWLVQARHLTSSAAVLPHGHPWSHAQKLIWKPAEEQGKPFNSMLNSILHQDGQGEPYCILYSCCMPCLNLLSVHVLAWQAQPRI